MKNIIKITIITVFLFNQLYAQNFSFSKILGDSSNSYISVGNNSCPKFVDLDNDADLDLFVGDYYGKIKVFTNDGSGNYIYSGNLQADGSDIDVGENATPEFADLDNDNDLDLFVGNKNGYVKYFVNMGNGIFTEYGFLEADSLLILVAYNSAPKFADLDNDNDLDLYVGVRNGNIYTFLNNGTGVFFFHSLLESNGSAIDIGYNSTLDFVDLDNDNDLDLYVGEESGVINRYLNNGDGTFSNNGNMQANSITIDIGNNSAPIFTDIDNDNDIDLCIGEENGNINIFLNDGTNNFSYANNIETNISYLDAGTHSTIEFADINSNDTLDLFVGTKEGIIKKYSNDGNGNFTFEENMQADSNLLDVGSYSVPRFIDINSDSYLDLCVSEFHGAIYVYLNDSNGNFTSSNLLQADGTDINTGSYSRPIPVFVDMDNDNDLDLLIGTSSGYINYYVNNGANNFTDNGMLKNTYNNSLFIGYSCSPITYDIDNDNDLDLFVGDISGVVHVYYNNGDNKFEAGSNLQADEVNIDLGSYSYPIFANLYNNCIPSLYIGSLDGQIKEYNALDNTNPIIICVDDQEIESVEFPYIINGTIFDPISIFDNCNIDNITNNLNGLNTLDGQDLHSGTNEIIWTIIDEQGNSSNCQFNINVTEITTINNIHEQIIKVSPNPVIDFLHLQSSELIKSVVVISSSGQEVKVLTVNQNNYKIDMSQMSKGVFIIKIFTEKALFYEKIIKQ